MKKWNIKYLLDLHWRSRAPDLYLVFYIGLDRSQDPAPRQSNNITVRHSIVTLLGPPSLRPVVGPCEARSRMFCIFSAR